MRKNISPKYFGAFLAVVESSSFSTAANKAYMTQANISKHIQALEDELGHALFIRTSKTPIITEAGKSLLEYIKKVEDLNAELLVSITGSQQSMKGVVRYAMPHSRMLDSHFSKLKDNWDELKNIEMNVYVENQVDIIAKVLDGSVDFGFVTQQVDNMKLHYRLLAKESYVLVGADKTVLESIKNSEDLLAQKYIEYPGMSGYFDGWKSFYFPKANFVNSGSLYYGGRANNIDSAILMVKGGIGISVFPRNYVYEYINNGQCIGWDGQEYKPFNDDIYIVTLADQVMSRRINLLIDFFINTVNA